MSYESNQMQAQPEQITPEEMSYLRNCLRKSFWTSSVPTAIAASGLFWIVQVRLRGKPHSNITTVLTGIGGAIIGRISSYPECIKEMIEEFPDGAAARQFHESRNFRPGQRQVFQERMNEMEPSSRAFTAEHKAPSFLDIDINVPEQKGLSESALPLEEDAISKASMLSSTYEEMRRKNREQLKQTPSRTYSGQDLSSGNPSLAPIAAPSFTDTTITGSIYMDSPSPPTFSDTPAFDQSHSKTGDEPKKSKYKRYNKYGDEIEE